MRKLPFAQHNYMGPLGSSDTSRASLFARRRPIAVRCAKVGAGGTDAASDPS